MEMRARIAPVARLFVRQSAERASRLLCMLQRDVRLHNCVILDSRMHDETPLVGRDSEAGRFGQRELGLTDHARRSARDLASVRNRARGR